MKKHFMKFVMGGILSATIIASVLVAGAEEVNVATVTTANQSGKIGTSIDDDNGRLKELVFLYQWNNAVAWNNHVAEQKRQKEAREQEEKKKQTTTTTTKPAPNYESGGSVWDTIAQCESGGNWSHPPVGPFSGNPSVYSGGLMFDHRYWKAMGGSTQYPYQASRAEQIRVAEKILAANGWNAWPVCRNRVNK